MDEFDLYFDDEYDEDDEGIAICECCGNFVYIGDAMCFVCPECGAAQNL